MGGQRPDNATQGGERNTTLRPISLFSASISPGADLLKMPKKKSFGAAEVGDATVGIGVSNCPNYASRVESELWEQFGEYLMLLRCALW